MRRSNRKSWLLIGPLLAVALPALAYNLGNYRRDMDEANRQRMSAEFRRDAQVSARRNEELRQSNSYQSSGSGSVSRGGSKGTDGNNTALPYPTQGDSGPQAIESTTTVVIRGKETENETAQRILKEAEAGNLISQWNAGRLYFMGSYGGVSRDDGKAAMWFRKAAEAGHAPAALAYGEMAFNGKGTPQSEEEAGRWFRFAAEKGIPRAMFFWGTLLEVGHGTARDNLAAFGWIKKAAEQKESNAYRSLGNMYLDGRGTAIDLPEAVKWLNLAVKNGDADACVDLGGLYYQGKGVPKNDAEAGRLFLKGAEAGNRNAMDNAGIMYEKGVFGVAQDTQKAIYWYGKAAAAGSQDAKREYDRLMSAPPSPSPTAQAKPGSAPIAGRYTAQGKNPDGSIYGAEVTVEQQAKGYLFVWKFNSTTMRGTGDYADGKLVIDWGSTYPAIYTPAQDGRLLGTWNNGTASEILTPVR